MISLILYFTRRNSTYVWKPALDLRDTRVAAALVPMMHS